MKKSKLIGQVAHIKDYDGIYSGEWGIIKDYDGELYYIAIANGCDSIPVFARDEFIVRRKENKCNHGQKIH